jgi:hypothetical protein
MRTAAALLTFACLSACSVAPPQPVSEQALVNQDGWRQQQAVLDAQAILEGMAQARNRAQQLARTGH